ncbi:energy-coupling factor transporter ATPase [Thermoflavimicrobium dichotomicum]|uniref:Energy-coupling factor transport system ATP-binding protein n=1 Tax=Thermoflavimicrobium dichotomicum TaxID=46223 RepID=A0A1I3R018_9BACL|nr:energy-coupling factor transporter ATPase [Thermoflavimicrobium dichotomicum]SFJ38737.1 energy-coupling factor transport system ATP-binding protein [Thermoflavimicrobium dichotomicum]
MKPIIRLQDVWFQYPGTQHQQNDWVLSEVNLSIDSGEYIAIIGPNGSGKSTLARLLNGLLVPSKGEVWVAGLSTQDEKMLWQVRRTVGMIFQNPDNQIVATTVRDDVAFGLENLGIPRSEMVERITDALSAVGLTGMEEVAPHYLSGGQKQRLSIAGVMAMQPQVIVFDESTSMLDPQGRKDVLALIHSLHQNGTTVIHITHSAEEAFLAERIIVMAEGQIQLDCPRDELYSQALCLQRWGLEVPLAVQLHHRLRKKGVPLSAQVKSNDDLVNQLCTLLSKD